MFNSKDFKNKGLESLKGSWVPALKAAVFFAAIYVFIVFFLQYTFLETLFVISITGILNLALVMFFTLLTQTRNQAFFSDFLDCLNFWVTGIMASFWMTLWIILWSLLFFVPGMIKAIAYSQTYFILAENPEISVRKAVTLSKIITKGYKGDIFIFYLSFIGWIFLSMLTGGIGFIFLIPYFTSSSVFQYRFLKKQALETKIVEQADFQ
ncbi:MAG: DUF975 family protein [Candidatus Treponema excrementipullorum]|nr:DUF975 family protein [Candidatus Treponema excrementipullorum]